MVNEIETNKREPGKKSKAWPVIIAGLFLLVAGAYLMWAATFQKNVVGVEEVQQQEDISAALRATYQPTRDYGLGTWKDKQFNIDDVFHKLPPIPDDFYKYKNLIMKGGIGSETLCELSFDYYSQPEFYGDSFIKSGLKYYKTPDPKRWIPEGYGTFPHEMETMAAAGDTFRVCSFFHTSYGVQTYQGLSLNPAYPSSAKHGGVDIITNSSEAKKYFEINISPSSVLIEPAYFIFEPGWTKKVEVNVKISPDTPSGFYALGFDVGRANMQDTATWQAQYAENYFSKSGISVGVEQFVMVVQVE